MSLPVDHLYVACTRPLMKMGVTYGGYRANFVVTLVGTVFFVHNPLGLIFGVLVHFVLRELCRIDPHFFYRWKLYFQTRGLSGFALPWGAVRLDPTPAQFRHASEVPSCA